MNNGKVTVSLPLKRNNVSTDESRAYLPPPFNAIKVLSCLTVKLLSDLNSTSIVLFLFKVSVVIILMLSPLSLLLSTILTRTHLPISLGCSVSVFFLVNQSHEVSVKKIMAIAIPEKIIPVFHVE